MVRQTSLLAWNSIQVDLGERQLRVLKAIQDFAPITNKDISGLVGLPINCVTPRTLELRQLGFVEECGVVKDKVTGRKAVTWRLKQNG